MLDLLVYLLFVPCDLDSKLSYLMALFPLTFQPKNVVLCFEHVLFLSIDRKKNQMNMPSVYGVFFKKKDKMGEFDIVCCGNCIGNLTD